jgi:hypothetical protein
MENAIGVRMHANRPSFPMMTPRCSTPGAVGMRSGRDRGWSRLVANEGNESISARTSVWYGVGWAARRLQKRRTMDGEMNGRSIYLCTFATGRA